VTLTTRVAAALLVAVLGVGLAPAAHAAPVPRAQQQTTPGSPDEFGVSPDAQPDQRGDDAFASPAVADLQRQATSVQDELTTLQTDVLAAQATSDAAAADLAAADADLAAAQSGVDSDQGAVDAYTRSLWTDLGPPSAAKVLLTADSPDAVLDGLDLVASVREQQNRVLTEAMGVRASATTARDAAAAPTQTARDAAAELATREGDARGRASALSADLGRALSAVDAQVVALQQAQQARNTETAANWQTYLDTLAAAGIAAPPAARLRDPAVLPTGLQPLVSRSTGTTQPGVAQATLGGGTTVLVLSAEAQRAVTVAIATLGQPYSPKGTGPRSWSCGGLVSTTSTQAGLPLPASPGEAMATSVPVDPADTQPGDLLFVGPAEDGVQSVAYVLDSATVLTADARTTAVVVADRPAADQVLGAARPSLGLRPAVDVPQPAAGRVPRSCGGVVSTPSTDGSLAWGGFPNGLIPASALCAVGIGSHRLRCDAAQTIAELSASYQGQFGSPLCMTDSYRPYAEQVDLYGRKPALAAVPGTSNHGWGLAVDLCGGIESYSTAQHAWMTANAGAFGWVHPSWARQGGGREEPWHWEYSGA
jgi:cell wall-associated NlpC family hydrolase